ncbi:MAG TPA: hypothetical protein VJ696_02130 [Rhodanobacteraceae bacterium]|nr:hypothetical protein [Rhodanobacteraceae bacterium]
MFKDESLIESPLAFWRAPEPVAFAKPARAVVPALVEDEVGAVAHVYREIAQRISRNSYTRHASTLGDALR